MKDNKHQFALYWEHTTKKSTQTTFVLDDLQLIHRITTIIRLKIGEEFILFDRTHNCIVEITGLTKKHLTLDLKKCSLNSIYTPHITFFLPLLKSQQLEEALYSLTECGISHIQLILTEKVHSKRYTDQMHTRCEKIVVAAAEQSKNYAIPIVSKPIELSTVFAQYKQIDYFIHFDVNGGNITSIIDTLKGKKNIGLLVGPEGDLSETEKKLLRQRSVEFIHLTPTVLRASQAALLAAGIVRSLS